MCELNMTSMDLPIYIKNIIGWCTTYDIRKRVQIKIKINLMRNACLYTLIQLVYLSCTVSVITLYHYNKPIFFFIKD